MTPLVQRKLRILLFAVAGAIIGFFASVSWFGHFGPNGSPIAALTPLCLLALYAAGRAWEYWPRILAAVWLGGPFGSLFPPARSMSRSQRAALPWLEFEPVPYSLAIALLFLTVLVAMHATRLTARSQVLSLKSQRSADDSQAAGRGPAA